MKLSALSVPILLTGLLFVAIWGLGQLTVQAGKTATQTSLELLRQQLEIQRLQEQLAARSHGKLLEQLKGLPASETRAGDSPAPPRPDPPSEGPTHLEFRVDPMQPKPWPTS